MSLLRINLLVGESERPCRSSNLLASSLPHCNFASVALFTLFLQPFFLVHRYGNREKLKRLRLCFLCGFCSFYSRTTLYSFVSKGALDQIKQYKSNHCGGIHLCLSWSHRFSVFLAPYWRKGAPSLAFHRLQHVIYYFLRRDQLFAYTSAHSAYGNNYIQLITLSGCVTLIKARREGYTPAVEPYVL